MKKLLILLVLAGSIAGGIALAGGFEGSLEQALAWFSEQRILPAAPPRAQPATAASQHTPRPAARTPASTAPRAKIVRGLERGPQETLTQADRDRLNKIIDDRIK